ncbi:MAG: hypothetical protein WAV45_16665 [Propionibacteriaceae bacterium]|nr:hypothetical protein [Micropruina sp.]HBX80352.1 hypothetical protein [Propionibacteriaceae bacterium]HBY22468.1 hypothetical protein [Propionibacteriaceae bacterium]
MSWFGRKRKGEPGVASGAPSSDADPTASHLAEFARTRVGVEAFLERPTTVTRTSLLLVAADGEWTRRSVASEQWARRFASEHRLPIYEPAVVGYPQRMRDYNSRQRGR